MKEGVCASDRHNVASAVRRVSDIGLGAALGSNVIAIPLVVAIAYWASRTDRLGNDRGAQRVGRRDGGGGGAADDDRNGEDRSGEDRSADRTERGGAHARHLKSGILRTEKAAVRVQALPYLGIVGLFAVLTLPPAWRGLQPMDGWILLAAYVAYLAQALLRGRDERKQIDWSRTEILLAVAGVAVLALGAFLTVQATENIVAALGIDRIVGGLFITAPMAALPELFAVWSVVRSGEVTSASTSVIGDHAVTMTVAFLPLALVTLPVQDVTLFATVLAFVALMPAAYAAVLHWGAAEHGVQRWQALLLLGLMLAYVGVMLFGVLGVLS